MNNKLLTLIIVLFLLPVVSAANFDVTADAKITELCPSATDLYPVIVTNTDQVAQSFSVNLAKSAMQWSTSVPTGFALNPGQSKTIYTYITPKTSTSPGSYNLDIIISSTTLSKTVSTDIEVLDCHKVSIEAITSSGEMCPEDIIKYDLKLENPGIYQEDYRLEVNGNVDVELSDYIVTLNPGESKTISAYVDKVAKPGDYGFSVVAKTSIIDSASVTLKVNPCYKFDVDPEKDYHTICEHSREESYVTITNTGSKTNNFALSLTGSLWANLEKNSLILQAGQSSNVKIIFNPDYSVNGEVDLTLKVISLTDNVQVIKLLKANVPKCHSVALALEKEEDTICNSLSNTYEVSLKNDGLEQETYILSLNAPTWVSLDKSSVILNPGKEEKVSLTVSPKIDTAAGAYDLKVTAKTLDEGRTAEDTIKIKVLSTEKCYEPAIAVKKSRISLDQDNSEVIPITLSNNGAEKATYILDISGTASSFVQLNPSTLTISPNKADITYLYVAPSEDIKKGVYSATITARLDDTTILDTKTVDITVQEIPEKPVKDAVSIWDILKKADIVWKWAWLYKWYVSSGLVILIVLMSLAKGEIFTKAKDFFEEEDFEEEKPKKKEKTVEKKVTKKKQKKNIPWLWVIIAAVILIAGGLIYYFKFYNIILSYLKLAVGYVWIYKWYVLAGIAALVVVLLVLIYKKHIKDFFEEEDLEKEIEELDQYEEVDDLEDFETDFKWVKWVVLAIILGAISFLVYYFKLYSYLAYLGFAWVYKWYILIGIIVLALLIIILRFRKSILEFFEEEDLEEEPKKKNNKKK